MTEALHILVAEARFYEDIADELMLGACAVLDDAGATYETVAVPGAFEIPAAFRMAEESGRFDGYVALGCVIRGETDHYEHICREVSRALMEFTINEQAPHGFGILTCENRDQAWERADVEQRNLGARAARACLRMMELKDRFLPASL